MKRDMGLIRHILEFVEEHGDGTTEGNLSLSEFEVDVTLGNIGPDNETVTIETYTLPVIHYHAWLCVDAGFVKGSVSLDPRIWASSYLAALTWKGHEYLHKLRNPPFLANRD